MIFVCFSLLFYVPAIFRLRELRGTGLGAPVHIFRLQQDGDLGAICEARGASDCKHNYDLHTYRRGALHSWPALLLYRHGSLWDPTARWQEQFWRVPPRTIPIAGVPISTTPEFGARAMTQPPDPTLPSRAHHKDYVSRTTSSNYHHYIISVIVS